MSRRYSVVPQAAQDHRSVTTLDSVPPPATHPDWLSADGYPVVRIYADVTLTGGTNPSVELSAWVRSPDGTVARAPAPDDRWATGTLTIAGSDKVAFDVLAEGDDVLVLVEAINGGPASWSVTLKASGR